MKKFEATFGAVPDSRAANARHPLLEVLVIALAATLCGAQSCVDMALFARSKEEGFLREIVAMEHGPPSHDTFSRCSASSTRKPSKRRSRAPSPPNSRASSPSTGKALKGAYERGARSSPLHLVNVWVAEARFVVAQRFAPGRNEVQGVLDALALLDLEDCIVTADALHRRKDVAAAIRRAGGDYALAIKANQPRLLAEAERRLADGRRKSSISGVEERHDRAKVRRASIIEAQGLEETCGFAGACALARVDAVRQTADGAQTVSTRCFILSALLTTDRLARVVRAHWTIENNLHWALDVAFNEDGPETAPDTARKTSPSSAKSRSTSSAPIAKKARSKESSSEPDGTTPSSKTSSLICDSPGLTRTPRAISTRSASQSPLIS